MVLAQYYNFVRYGYEGYSYIMHTMQSNALRLASEIEAIGEFEIIGAENAEQLPLVAFRLADEHSYDEFDISAQLASERGWMVPAYTFAAQRRSRQDHALLVKETLGRSMTTALGGNIAQACSTLEQKGRMHDTERKRVHTSTGY